jgi:hypothetical protein
MNGEFSSNRSSKNTRISNFMKFRPVGAELLHADRRSEDGRTDRHDEANFWTDPTTLCFVWRTFIVLRTLHSHYRKQNLGPGIIILGSGNSTVHQGCHPLLVVSLGGVLCHDYLITCHVRETFYSTAQFMTYAKPRDSVVHELGVQFSSVQFSSVQFSSVQSVQFSSVSSVQFSSVPVMLKHFELSRNEEKLPF